MDVGIDRYDMRKEGLLSGHLKVGVSGTFSLES